MGVLLLPFEDEETEAQRLDTLSEATQLEVVESGLEPGQSGSRVGLCPPCLCFFGPSSEEPRARGRGLSSDWCQTPCGALAHFLSRGLATVWRRGQDAVSHVTDVETETEVW